MDTEKDNREEFIQALNEIGYNILFINDRYYVAESWIHSENMVTKHSLKGKDITKIIHGKAMSVNLKNIEQQKLNIYSEIEDLKLYYREFHKDEKYIFYPAHR